MNIGNIVRGILAGCAAISLSIWSYILGKKSGYTDGHNNGVEKTTSKYDLIIEKYKNAFEKAKKLMDKNAQFEKIIYALYAIASAFTSFPSEGAKVSADKRKISDKIIVGMTSTQLPKSFINKIDKMWESPPNLSTAYELTNKAGLNSMEIFDLLIELLVMDPNLNENKNDFQSHWNDYSKAN